MRRYPNRTGGLGEISGGSITLTGTALPGMRSFADAVTAGKLAAGQLVGIAVRSVADPNAWITGTALYHSTGRLDIGAVEDASTTALADEAAVEVVACVTDAMLSLLDGGDPIYWDGPAYWTPEAGTPDLGAWDEDAWVLVEGQSSIVLEPSEWVSGYRPGSLKVDIYVPLLADLGEVANCNVLVIQAAAAPIVTPLTGLATGWNTLSIDLAALASDIQVLVFDINTPTTYLDEYRFRHVLFGA